MLVGRAGLSPVMIGRAADMERLTALVEEVGGAAGGGRGARVALVAGEAGMGKTRLVRELVGRAPSGTTVLAGQADPGSLGRPFSLLADVVDAALGDPGALSARLGEEASRPSQVAGALAVVDELLGDRPALLVFEDLHWADAESLEVFERLVASDRARVLIGTYRTNELTRRHPATDLLLRLERRITVTHVHLARFTSSEVSQFLAAVFGEHAPYRAVEQLHARSGGNPFFLEELVTACRPESAQDLCGDQPLPWSLNEVVRSQLDDLDPEERRIAEAAAVLGRRVPFDLLATVARRSEDELITLLRRLVDRDLLAEPEPDVFSFRHALVSETVAGELLGRERRRLHEAALAALLESGSDDHAALAHHAEGAGRLDQMVAFARTGAGRYLDHGSTHQALQLAELGLSEVPDDLELLRVATVAAWLVGILNEALHHAERWRAAAAGAGDPEAEAAALRHLARVHWDLGRGAEMWEDVEVLEEVAARLGPSDAQARAFTFIAQMHMLARHTAEAVRWAERALVVAEDVGARTVRPQALVEKGSALLDWADRRQEGKALLAEAAAAAEAVGDDITAARALHNISSWIDMTSPAEAAALLDRMRRAAERAGFESLATVGYAMRHVDLAMWLGDRSEALAWLETGRDGLIGVDTVSVHDIAMHDLHLALELGHVERAAELLAELRSADGPAFEGERQRWLDSLELVLMALAGEAASERAAAVRDRLFSPGLPFDSGVLEAVGSLLQAGLAPDVMAEAISKAGLDEPSEGAVLLAGLVAAAKGDHGEAVEALRRGLDEGVPLPRPMIGDVRLAMARSLLAIDRLDEARAEVEAAAALLERWPGRRRQELEALQRRLGRGAEPEGPDELTPREREVAALLADGLSNAELAERLYISPKTAAVHVSNILAKLGMSSRAEIAAWAVRKGVARSA